MADFNIRSESVDVEQIMKQIRSRIREKRGVDYTEDQIRELATVRLEKFLDPKNLRSDLLEQFRRSRPAVASEPAPVEAPFEFHDQTLFETHRGVLRFIRKLLNPILKLFFNPNPLINVLHTQAQFNVDLLKREQRRKIEFDRSRAEWNALYYEVLHNLVLETTRSGIEIKNLKMRVEALTSRLDFSERRVRALEGVVQYRPEAVRRTERERDQRESIDDVTAGDGRDVSDAGDGGGVSPPAPSGEGAKRRRRRRRGRRGTSAPGAAGPQQNAGEGDSGVAPFELEADNPEPFEDGGDGVDFSESGIDEPTTARPTTAGQTEQGSLESSEPRSTSPRDEDSGATSVAGPTTALGETMAGHRSETTPSETTQAAEADQDRRPPSSPPDDDHQQ